MQKIESQTMQFDGALTGCRGVDPLLKIMEVGRITAQSPSAINRGVAAGTFPAPFRIGKRAIAWKFTDIATWMSGLEKTVSVEG